MLLQAKGLNWLYFVTLTVILLLSSNKVNPLLRENHIAVVPMLTDFTCVTAASYDAKLRLINIVT